MLTSLQYAEVWKALYDGFSERSIEQMLRHRLDKSLSDLVPPGTMRDMVSDLLLRAEREGWTLDLIREAYLYNPRNPSLFDVYQKYGSPPEVVVQAAGVPESPTPPLSVGLERAVRLNVPGFNFAVFRDKLAQIESRVCRVEIGGQPVCTGFLVGPAAVLTAYSGLRDVLERGRPAADVACRFDFTLLAQGRVKEGLVVPVHPTDGLLDSSPFAPAEATTGSDHPPPTADQLDYVLLRLARSVGDEPATSTSDPTAPRRGWIEVPKGEPEFTPHAPLMIAQYPDGRPLTLTIDTDAVIGLTAGGRRVRYTTNTTNGSSGAPVFDFNLTLVALHHYGEWRYNQPPTYKQGIPINKIRERIARTPTALAELG